MCKRICVLSFPKRKVLLYFWYEDQNPISKQRVLDHDLCIDIDHLGLEATLDWLWLSPFEMGLFITYYYYVRGKEALVYVLILGTSLFRSFVYCVSFSSLRMGPCHFLSHFAFFVFVRLTLYSRYRDDNILVDVRDRTTKIVRNVYNRLIIPSPVLCIIIIT